MSITASEMTPADIAAVTNNGGNGFGTIKLYEKQNGRLKLIDEVKATHIGCEYGEYTE